jgi:hypothetical protein
MFESKSHSLALEIAAVESRLRTEVQTRDAVFRKLENTRRKMSSFKLPDGVENIKEIDRTYSLINTTVFDVWNDLKAYEEGSFRHSTNLNGASSKRFLAMRAIARELRQRMDDANRSLPEALGDLEAARIKLRNNVRAGTISSLVSAIRLKNGEKIDTRRKQLTLEY